MNSGNDRRLRASIRKLLATGFGTVGRNGPTVGHTGEGYFFVDLKRPDWRMVENEEGEIADAWERRPSDVQMFLTPRTAKQLYETLEEQIEEYEETVGEIDVEAGRR